MERSRLSGIPSPGTYEREIVDSVLDGLALLALLVAWALASTAVGTLPDEVPIHFELTGTPDAWGSRGHIFILPGLGLVLFMILAGVARLPGHLNVSWSGPPERAAIQKAHAIRLVQILNLLIQYFFCWILWRTIEIAHGEATDLTWWAPLIFLFLVFSSVVMYFVVARRS